ncbi:hypothetical protein ET445_03495 [Agromyces protaetiae]|uniref:Uncharacterized protein n=1 Tax=Agromyces protaetiae TaxID=2509455 RepID=A0A4P6FAB8_9MICO|nr:hypothetical protein [Agromyces protaetiae]QAY72546.1 hypothetical protein ET445_03495 [Agromyces protaetiae]
MAEPEDSERRSIDEVVERLAERFPGADRAEIKTIVEAEYLGFEGKRVRDFVPVLVEKSAKKRLKALERSA